MLYLLNKDVRTVRWNGEPLHEATSAIVKETMNGDFTLTVKYPISDSGIYQLIQEDMLIKAPTPVLGAQLFRIKKPVEHNDHLEITAYHISDDVMQRSITPVSVTSQSCGMALSRMVQNTKTALGDFSFNSDIQDRRTFNTTETETLYSVLLDGKHSIVGTWEGELVRDNFAITVKKSRGENRGVVITTHKNLKDYQRTKNSQNVVTRIHVKSTFKPEGSEKETTIRVTVDSPLINSYPYINEKEYENNNAKSVEELRKWAQAKFSNEGIDKVSDAIKIEAYELDGQVVHMGDTVNLKSWKHNVDAFKKAIAYEFDALKEEYISLTFDDKAGAGGSRTSGGLSSAADAILGVTESAQEIALEKALQNADLGFDHQAGLLRQEILDGIELARAKAEEVKQELSDTIDQRFSSFNNGPLQEIKSKAIEALQNAGASSLLAQEAKRIGLDSVATLEEFKRQATSAQTALSGDLDVLKRTIANDIRPKQEQVTTEIAKQVEALVQTKKELAGVKLAQVTYEDTTTQRLAELTNLANGKASKSELTQTAEELASKIASVQVGSSRNYFRNSRSRTFTTGDQATYDYRTFIVPDFWKNGDRFKRDYVRLSFDVTFPVALASDTQANVHFNAHPWYAYRNLVFKGGTTERQHFEFTIDLSSSSETYQTNNVFICFGTNYGFPADLQVVIENAMLSVGNYFPAYQPAYEDQEDRVTVVESSFKQRADSLDAGVNRLTEGLRTKADISSLNVTAENIRQSVKSLETSTQNKLDQKLSMTEFEVRAGSIQQEILNVSKDKADKTLVVAEAGKLREEFSNLRVGGRNLIRNYDWNGLLPLNIFGSGWKFERVEDQFAKSGYMLKATCTKAGNGGFHRNLFDLRSDEFQGKDLTWSWEMKTSRPITFYNMGFEAGGLKRNVPVSTEWERISNTFKVAFKQFHSCVFYANGWQVGDVVYIRDPQLEEGTIATSPKPAPEDTDGLITEAKAIFERTAQGLRTDLSAIQEYVNKDGQRQDTLQRYTREESARQANAVRDLVSRDYVGKATHQEDVRGIERRLEAITNPQNGTIATQIANYKQSVDGRLTDITSLLSGKVNQTDFQHVKETSQLYERILGNTDNGIADNVARMAVTNQIFQVEVGKYGGGGPNLVKNSDFKDGTNEWASTQNLGRLVKHGFYHNSQKDLMRLSNSTQSENFLYSSRFELERNTDYVLNFRGFNNSSLVSYDVFILGRRAGETNGFTIIKQVVSGKKLSTARCEDVSITFNSGEMDNAFIRFDNNGAQSGTADLYIAEVDLYKGYKPRPWQPHPEDTDEAIRTVQSQLAGAWGVHNKNSVNEIIAGFNLAGRNAGIKAETIRLEGNTLADKLTAIDGYFKRLFVGEGTFATLNTDILRANSITADKMVMDTAFFNKFVSNEAYLSQLFAKQAFINRVQSITLDASQIKTGVLTGGRIHGGSITGSSIAGGTITGGTITGSSISGSTLTGHTKIQLGTYGSFDTVNGGLQINVPRAPGSKDGLGVQFIGSYGRGENVPYGLYIYKDPDFTTENPPRSDDNFLLTVEGYIQAKGIGWLRTGTGSVGDRLTATIGLWNSNNVYLSFGGSANDIFYTYNNKAYSIWEVIKAHFSDRRLKKNIVACQHKALDYINQFQFKEYDWKKQEDRPQQAHTKIGLIAQEVQAVDPTLVYENGDTLNLDNLRLTNIALKAIQELALENGKLKQRLENLESEYRTA